MSLKKQFLKNVDYIKFHPSTQNTLLQDYSNIGIPEYLLTIFTFREEEILL
jgi:hypothetical protein